MTGRPTWRDKAACHGSAVDFTIEQTETITVSDVVETRIAAAYICNGCPVRVECGATAEAERLAPAVTGEVLVRPFGILGGLYYDGTARPPTDPLRAERVRQLVEAGLPDGQVADRLNLTVEQVRGARGKIGLPAGRSDRYPRAMDDEFDNHGTRAGYLKHQRRGQTPCDPCADANAAAHAAKRARRRARREAA